VQNDLDFFLSDLRRSLEQDLGLRPSDPPKAGPPSGVAFMITKTQREKLRGLGYKEDQIRALTPEEARAILTANEQVE
jgi:hypothetical protein